jgi:hypothetical protein
MGGDFGAFGPCGGRGLLAQGGLAGGARYRHDPAPPGPLREGGAEAVGQVRRGMLARADFAAAGFELHEMQIVPQMRLHDRLARLLA